MGPGGSEGQFFGHVGVNFSYNGTMTRNGVSLAFFSVGEMSHRTILLRLSAVLRNAVVMSDLPITTGNC
jgi:hypothetical protein